MSLFPVLAASGAGGYDAIMLVVLVAVFGGMMFFTFRKQNKEQKEHDAMVNSVEKGDSIVTSSGFYGVVQDVTDEVVIVEFGNNKNCRIPMKKSHITEVEKAN